MYLGASLCRVRVHQASDHQVYGGSWADAWHQLRERCGMWGRGCILPLKRKPHRPECTTESGKCSHTSLSPLLINALELNESALLLRSLQVSLNSVLDCDVLFGFQLENRKAEIEEACVSYRNRITELWERLQIPLEERDSIAEHIQCSKKRNMDAVSFMYIPVLPIWTRIMQ